MSSKTLCTIIAIGKALLEKAGLFLYTDDDGVNPPKADKGLIPRRLRRYIAFEDTPLLCGGVVH